MNRILTRKELLYSTAVIAGAAGVTYLMKILADYRGRDFSHLSGDTIGILEASIVVGLFSRIGITVWAAAAVAFWMIWLYCRHHIDVKAYKDISLGFALVTSILYIDDFYMIHERVVRDWLNIPEEILMLAYFGWVLYLIIRYWRLLVKKGLLAIVLAFGFLGMSAGIDVFHGMIHIPDYMVFEDGAKFVGTSLWLLFALIYGNALFAKEL